MHILTPGRISILSYRVDNAPRPARAPRAPRTGPRHHRHRTPPARARAHGAARAMVLNNLAVWAHQWSIAYYTVSNLPWLALQWKDCSGPVRVAACAGSLRHGHGSEAADEEAAGRLPRETKWEVGARALLSTLRRRRRHSSSCRYTLPSPCHPRPRSARSWTCRGDS